MYQRYVAIGDSTTEGLEDADESGGYRGWADRLAQKLTEQNPDLRYANLAVRGKRLEGIVEQQLGPAIELQPDLVTAVGGLNDALSRHWKPQLAMAAVETMFKQLRATGADVVTFTYPDLSPVMPLARPIRPRVLRLNEWLRSAARHHGVLMLDLAAYSVAVDSRMWSNDRLHANTLGHTRIADGLAETLGLPGVDPAWAMPLPPRPVSTRRSAAAAELSWLGGVFLPWVVQHAMGRSSGDGVTAKRPHLEPLER